MTTKIGLRICTNTKIPTRLPGVPLTLIAQALRVSRHRAFSEMHRSLSICESSHQVTFGMSLQSSEDGLGSQ
jgi:hypothetical protein